MDFFLKRVPAFSRALGEDDSDDEPDIDNSDTEIKTKCLDSLGNSLTPAKLLSSHKISNMVVSLGALSTAFVTIGFRLIEQKPIGTLKFYSSDPDKSDSIVTLFLYHLSNISDGFYVLTTSADINTTNSIQRVCVDQLSQHLFTNSKPLHISILCTYPVHQFMSISPKPSTSPFMRYLHTQTPIESTQCILLEQPNIVTGLPAEFLTSCRMHSIPANLFICFYCPNSHLFCSGPAIKEVFHFMGTLKRFVSDFKSISENWDEEIDEKLMEQCTTLICGGKVTRTDQMYT